MAAKSITQTMTGLYELLEPLGSAERQRALKATLALLGEPLDGMAGLGDGITDPKGEQLPPPCEDLGDKATRWMRQNQVTRTALDQCFHIDGDAVDLIMSSVKGKSRREQTVNCYLMVGIRNLLANDEARFSDKEALDFCHLTEAYDKNNHTANRTGLGNRVSGGRSSGFVLTMPGLRDAANLIKELGSDE